MNPALVDMFQKLNLEPGTYRCELPEYEIVVTVQPRTAGDTAQGSDGESEAKDAPEIPVYTDEAGMLQPWVELPRPKPLGTVIAYPAPPRPPDIPKIPRWDEEE